MRECSRRAVAGGHCDDDPDRPTDRIDAMPAMNAGGSTRASLPPRHRTFDFGRGSGFGTVRLSSAS